MSIEFRQRSTGEYFQIIKRRKWLLVLPTLAVFTAIFWVVRGLPNYYESTAFLILKPPTISEKVAPSLTDEDLSQRLQSINQSVLSRTSLEPMIAKYHLYQAEKNAGIPMEQIVDKMKKNVKVELEKTDREKTAGFRLTCRDSDPKVAQTVTADLANKYVNAQVTASTQSAETTKEFIDNQMSVAKSNLDALEKERLKIMTQNVDALPESGSGLIAQLDGLHRREETISKDKETLILEKGRINESIRALNSQMRLIEEYGQKETQDAVDKATQVEDTPAYGQLIQRRAELSAKLENLKKQYRDKHPDIIQAQTDIEKVNEEIDKLAKNTSQRVQQANQSSSRKAELQKKSLEIERDKTQNQITQVDTQLQMKDDELRRNAGQITILESKINTIPNVKVALEAVENQYQTAKLNYDNILKKYNDAQQQVQRETNAQGETISIVDEANLPQSPANASKKPFFILMGAGLGLFLGLILVAIFEGPRLFKIQSIEDTKYYTGLPVLASIPPLLTTHEMSWRNGLHLMKIMGGIVIATVSVPLLVMLLQISHIFERIS